MVKKQTAKEQSKDVVGDEMLIPDILPKNIKAIHAKAEKYFKTIRSRMALGEKEADEKAELIDMVRLETDRRRDYHVRIRAIDDHLDAGQGQH